MNKKWLAALAAVMVAVCMGCKAKVPSYLIVHDTTVIGYTDDLPANLVIPKGITKIAGGAFAGCDWLKSVTIPGSVKIIGEDVIDDNVDSEELEKMEDDIDDEDICVFYNCTSLKNVTIENGVKAIGDGAFAECKSLVSVTIPKSVKTIGFGAFGECTSLKSVTIENGVETIGFGAFMYCSSLASMTIPKSVKTIGDGAFSYCTSLKDVTIGNGVREIGEFAFFECSPNFKIQYAGSKKQWEKIGGDDVMSDGTVRCKDGNIEF